MLSVCFGEKCVCGKRYRNKDIHIKSEYHKNWIQYNYNECMICLNNEISYNSCDNCYNELCKNCYYKLEKCPFCRDEFPMTDILFKHLVYNKLFELNLILEDEICIDKLYELYDFLYRYKNILQKPKFEHLRRVVKTKFDYMFLFGYDFCIVFIQNL